MNSEELCARAVSGEVKAMDQLIEYLKPSVESIAKMTKRSYRSSGLAIDTDDLIQEGLIALTRTVKTYQREKGNLFWTYAEPAVRNAMQDHIRKLLMERNAFGLPESLDDVTEEGDCNKRPLKELLTNEHIKTPEQIYIEKETHQEIHTALNNLSAREREYLYYRFGFIDEYHDRTETAYHFYLNNSRAKRLEEDALRNFYLELSWW